MPTAFDPYYEWLGIPRKDQPPHHYRLLGIELFEDNLNVIERAADRQMAHLRTLQTGKHGPLSQELLNQVAASKVCLLNPTKKAAYDGKLRDELAAKNSAAALLSPVAPAVSSPAFVMAAPTEHAVIRRPRARSLWSKMVLAGGVFATVVVVGGIVALMVFTRGKTVATGDTPQPSPPTQSKLSGKLLEPANSNSASDANRSPAKSPEPNGVVPEPAASQSAKSKGDSKQSASAATKDTQPRRTSEPKPEKLVTSAKPDADSRQAIDLLQKFDVREHTLQGETRFARGAFSTETTAGVTQVLIPYSPPLAYDLEIHAKRLEGNGSLNIGLLVGGQPGLLAFDDTNNGRSRTCSALVVQGANPRGNTYPGKAYLQQLLPSGETKVIRCEVRSNQVVAYCDGKLLCQWAGDPQSLFLPDSFSLPDSKSMQIGSWSARFEISKLELIPQAAEVASNDPQPGPPRGTNMLPAGTAAVQPEPPAPNSVALGTFASRAPVPDEPSRAEKLAQVMALYQSNIDQAKKPADKVSLAEMLAGQARLLQDDLAARYVLFDQAREFAIQGGSLPLSRQIIDELDVQFEVDALSMKVEALQRIGETTVPVEQRRGFFEVSLTIAKSALEAERFDLAQAASKVVDGAAGRLREAEARKTALQLRSDITRRKAQWEDVQKALTQLQSEPDNAVANLAAGKYFCFSRNAWERGLPHLARGGEVLLTQAAELDLAAGDDAKAQFAAAEAWEKAAQPAADSKKPALQRRAYDRYNTAAPQLTGLDKAKALQQLEALAAVGNSIHPLVPVTLANGSSKEVHPGLVGRMLVNGKDMGVLVKYDPGTEIQQGKLLKLLQEAQVDNVTALQIELNGFFTLTANSNLWAMQELGLPSGSLALAIANVPFHQITSSRRRGSRVAPIPQGDHTITWLLQGDVSQSSLTLQDNDTNERILFYYTEELLERTRKPPTRGAKMETKKEVNLSEN